MKRLQLNPLLIQQLKRDRFIYSIILTKAEKSFDISITTVAIAVLIIFQPIWCWLHDQFYWSNLLCIYLLVYAFADLLADQKIGNTYLVKLALTLITLAGFYPSQLPLKNKRRPIKRMLVFRRSQ